MAAVGLAAALGAAAGAAWDALRPGGPPGLPWLALMFAGAAAAGTAAAVRPRGILPRRRLLLLARAAARLAPEVLLGVAGAALLTRRPLPCLLVLAMLHVVRRQAFVLARRVATMRTAGRPATVLRARRAVARWVPVALAAALLAIAGSGLDRSGNLWAWRSAPLVLGAGTACLILLTGAEHEALAARFRQARASVDPGLGSGWWRAAGGWIALVVAAAAVLPPPPGALALGHVETALENWTGRLLLLGATPAGTVPTAHAAAPRPASGLTGWRERAVVALTLSVALGLALWAAVDLWRATGRLRLRWGLGPRDVLNALVDAVRDAAALLRGVAAALAEELGSGGWIRTWQLVWLAMRGAVAGLVDFARGLWPWRGRPRRRGASQSTGGVTGATLRALPRQRAWDLPPDSPRRQVREVYRAFIAQAERAGLGRSPGQTPASHRRAVEAADPASAGAVGELTEAYEWARFSPHRVTTEHVEAARHGWRRLAQRLAARVRRGRGA